MSEDAPAILAGDGFLVRRWRASDKASLLRHADDEQVSVGLSDHFPWPYTPADADDFLQGRVIGTADALAIEIDGAAVGGIGMQRGVDVHRHGAEIGYWLGRAYWGRGLMSRIVPAWRDHLFATQGYRRLEAKVYSNNPASAHLLEKCGFVREGIKREAAVKRGEVLDVWIYAILRSSLTSP
jgi:RimJ/RimL family protein N-acetyltransferase